MIISALSCLSLYAADTLLEEVNLRNDSIFNNMVPSILPGELCTLKYGPSEEIPLAKLFFSVFQFLQSSTSLGECCHALGDPTTGSQNSY